MNSLYTDKTGNYKIKLYILFNLEEFILNNEPTEHDIKEFPITEAFQFTTDIDKVYNRWELIRAKLSKAREAEKENQQLMRNMPRKMKENKNELDSLMAGVLQGNSKTNAMGVFTDLEVMQKTGDKYLRHIKQDLQALEKEADDELSIKYLLHISLNQTRLQEQQ